MFMLGGPPVMPQGIQELRRRLQQENEREEILSGEEKNEPSLLVQRMCLLTEATPS
jgi:hypothetical protein